MFRCRSWESVATMLGGGSIQPGAETLDQQLLLMEERATIARELHDSLWQVLSIGAFSLRCSSMPCRATMLRRRPSSRTSPAS
ncbi:histidine kinase [Shigella flexneri]